MRALKFILAVGLLGLLAACGGGGNPTPTVASVTVTPPSASVAVGKTTAFAAVAKDAGGNTLSGVTFAWTSSDKNVATVNSSGVTKGVAPGGPVTITASAGGESASAKLTVTGSGGGGKPVINSFSANPASITAGQSSTLSWSVTGATSLSINHGAGTVTGASKSVSPTTTTTYTLTATNRVGSTTKIAKVTVSGSGGGGSVASITVSPSDPSIAEGSTQQLSATAKDSSGKTLGVTFTWTSSDNSVATVDSTGLATGVAAGNTTITASAGGKSGSASLTVVGSGNGDFGISVAPAAPSVAQGGSSSVTVSISRYANNVGNVQLSLTGNVPSGLTANFSPNPETGSGSTLTLTASASTAKGTYNLFVEGQSSQDTETTALTVTVTAPHDTLLVDQDDSSNNYGYDSNLSASDSLFQTLLNSAGVGYDVYVAPNGGNGPNASQLEKYTTVIWYNGNAYYDVPTSADKLSMQTYLDQGGKKLVLFYTEYPYDIGANWTSTSGDSFFANYIGAMGGVEAPYNNAKGSGLNHQSYPVAGVSSVVTSGDSYNVQNDTPLKTYTSAINPAAGTDALLTVSADPDRSGTDRDVPIIVGRKSVGTAGSSKVIYSGLTFENIYEPASDNTNKLQLLKQLLSY
jgi:uncharacterized protein YjdB